MRAALGEQIEYRRVEVVGPRVSGELLSYGTLGIIAAIGAILIYLWFRFEWQFALGAMIANVHDLVLTLGFMAVMQIDFDLTSIAALLTILGYSLNDTVVIYDRIREMLRRYKKLPMTGPVEHLDQLDAVALDHHALDRDARAARAVPLRRPRDPRLRHHHDVRRGAGRHLHVGVHRGADPDLSRRRHRAGRKSTDAAKASRAPISASRPELAWPWLDDPHLPQAAAIDAYGKGGFRFADMSHRGSILCLPDGHLGLAGDARRRRSTKRAWRACSAPASNCSCSAPASSRG